MNLQFLNFLLLIVVLFTGCEQNPYPKEGELVTTGKTEQRVVEPPLALAVDDVIEFKEGSVREFKIRAAVREPGEALVDVEGLPPGAEFDAKTFVLRWTPDYFAGNDPADPTIKSRIYPLTIWLRSNLDSVRALKKVVSLIVYDVPRGIQITTSNAYSVNEGEKLSSSFIITNKDFPSGPFRVLLSGFPANTTLIKVDELNYQIEFSPDYNHVNRLIHGNEINYQGKIIVSNLANHMVEKSLIISVQDVRLEPRIAAPPELTQGLDVSFQVVAYDLNREMSPVLELIPNYPAFGTFKTEVVKSEENHSTVLNVYWNDIPPTHNGEKHTLNFRACVVDRYTNLYNCKESPVVITTVVRERVAPLINRDGWQAGEMLYLGFEQVVSKRITIRDGENIKLHPKVLIYPENMRKYVKWENDQLNLQFSQPGIFQFNLVATSDYNVSSAESFLVEVFPKERNKILFFADSTRDPEVIFYKSTFKNIDIMNPAIQDIDSRNLSGRDTLVIGTSTLMEDSVQPKVQKAIDKIKNIVVASPLIDKLPQAFLNKLRDDYDLVTLGRYRELPNLPPLDKVRLVTTGQFQTPTAPVTLKLSASSESKDPMIFNGGLDDPQKICKGVIGLSEDGNNPYRIGVVCKKEDGGRVSLLGTEWADLQVSEADAEIPVNWFNTMTQGQF